MPLKILYKYDAKKINLIKMWFVITKQSGIINKHSHFDSDLSGVLYLKVNLNSSNSGLDIFNPLGEMDIYKYNLSLNIFYCLVHKKIYVFYLRALI